MCGGIGPVAGKGVCAAAWGSAGLVANIESWEKAGGHKRTE